MAKRLLQETQNDGALVTEAAELRAKKRSKKDKAKKENMDPLLTPQDTATPTPPVEAVVNEMDLDAAVDSVQLAKIEKRKRKEAKKLKKLQKALSDRDSADSQPDDVTIPAPQVKAPINTGMTEADLEKRAKVEKQQRKELKKLQKLKLGEPIFDPVDAVMNGIEQEAVDEKAAKKAARKARKAEKKAQKETRGEKKAEQNEDPKAQTSATTTSSHATGAIEHVATRLTDVTVSTADGYSEDPRLSSLPQADIDSFLSKNFITITDPASAANPLRPIIDFRYLPGTNKSQLAPFKSFSSPTPIQAGAWPPLFAGRDVIGVAETGSGKTLAFAVPCIRYITSLTKKFEGVTKKFEGAKAVVISPTRELAMQIYEQILTLAEPASLKVVCVYGGVAKEQQRNDLKKASIIVATPGRLQDLINEGAADLSQVGYLVLDEADRMLDKGFEDAIREIIKTTPPIAKRQTIMFTATWPQSVRELASTFMKSPVKITIGDNPTGDLRANSRIVQKVEVVDPRGKEQRLLQLLREHQSGASANDRILVFCLYKKEATRVEGYLKSKGMRVAGIHGDLSQPQRTASLDAFKSGKVPLLVATDVAARGLDIPAVKMVINVTFPLTVEDYVHRIGRTGRAGKEGIAITLFTEHDKAQSGALINVLKAANQPIPDELLKFGTTVKKKTHEAYGAFYKDNGPVKAPTRITFDD